MLMNLNHGQIRFGCIKHSNLLVVSGWVQNFPLVMGWVGLGQSADGLDWIGSYKMDPWTTLQGTAMIATYHWSNFSHYSRISSVSFGTGKAWWALNSTTQRIGLTTVQCYHWRLQKYADFPAKIHRKPRLVQLSYYRASETTIKCYFV